MKPFALKSVPSILVVSLLVSMPLRDVRAQPGSGSEAGQDADQLFQKGKALYQSGKMREAYDALRAAWASKKSFDIAGNLGTVELGLGMYRDAAEHLAYGIRTFPSTGNKKHLAATKQQFDDVRGQVGALMIKVSVDGAEVRIDGKPIGRSPIQDEVFVEPGERTIEVKLLGYESAKQSVKILKGGSQSIALSPVLAVAPPVASASASAAPALTASGSAEPPPISLGSATPIVPEEHRGPSKPVLITGGVVTGLAVVAGVVFTVIANGKASDVDSLAASLKQLGATRPCQANADTCISIDSKLRAQGAFSNAAMGSFITAGALAIGTLGYALFAPRGQGGEVSKGAKTRVVPMLTSQQGGVLVMGAW